MNDTLFRLIDNGVQIKVKQKDAERTHVLIDYFCDMFKVLFYVTSAGELLPCKDDYEIIKVVRRKEPQYKVGCQVMVYSYAERRRIGPYTVKFDGHYQVGFSEEIYPNIRTIPKGNICMYIEGFDYNVK